MHPFRQAIWRHIWRRTVEKKHTNAINVIMHPLRQAIWRHIWKHTVEKKQTNATSVTLHPFKQAVWRNIWEHTVEKSQTNVAFVKKDLDEMMKYKKKQHLCVDVRNLFIVLTGRQILRGIKQFILVKNVHSLLSKLVIFRKHLLVLTDKGPIPCNGCGKHFKQNWALKIHKNIHIHQKTFPCKICGKTF